MQIDIRSNVRQVSAWLDDAQRQQLPFATALAMTRTAQEVKDAEISLMKRVFDRPTPYTLNALFVRPAKKRHPIASVEFKEFAGKGTPAKRFLNPHVNGGARSRKSHERRLQHLMRGASFTAIANGYPRDGYGNIPGSTYVRILSQLQASADPTQNATGSRRSKAKRAKSRYFIPAGGSLKAGVYERVTSSSSTGKRQKGVRKPKDKIRGVLMFTRPPHYTKRFPFYETGAAVVADRFDEQFKVAFQYAMGTAKTPK